MPIAPAVASGSAMSGLVMTAARYDFSAWPAPL